MSYNEIKDDVSEIKGDVKEIRGMLVSIMQEQARYEQNLNHLSGKVNSIIAVAAAIVSGLALAFWDYIKAKFL